MTREEYKNKIISGELWGGAMEANAVLRSYDISTFIYRENNKKFEKIVQIGADVPYERYALLWLNENHYEVIDINPKGVGKKAQDSEVSEPERVKDFKAPSDGDCLFWCLAYIVFQNRPADIFEKYDTKIIVKEYTEEVLSNSYYVGKGDIVKFELDIRVGANKTYTLYNAGRQKLLKQGRFETIVPRMLSSKSIATHFRNKAIDEMSEEELRRCVLIENDLQQVKKKKNNFSYYSQVKMIENNFPKESWEYDSKAKKISKKENPEIFFEQKKKSELSKATISNQFKTSEHKDFSFKNFTITWDDLFNWYEAKQIRDISIGFDEAEMVKLIKSKCVFVDNFIIPKEVLTKIEGEQDLKKREEEKEKALESAIKMIGKDFKEPLSGLVDAFNKKDENEVKQIRDAISPIGLYDYNSKAVKKTSKKIYNDKLVRHLSTTSSADKSLQGASIYFEEDKGILTIHAFATHTEYSKKNKKNNNKYKKIEGAKSFPSKWQIAS